MVHPNRAGCVVLRNLIIEHYKNGRSQRKIAKIVKKARTTVENIIHRFKNENRVINKPKIGPKSFSDRQGRWIVKQSKIDPRLSHQNCVTWWRNILKSIVTLRPFEESFEGMGEMVELHERNPLLARRIKTCVWSLPTITLGKTFLSGRTWYWRMKANTIFLHHMVAWNCGENPIKRWILDFLDSADSSAVRWRPRAGLGCLFSCWYIALCRRDYA